MAKLAVRTPCLPIVKEHSHLLPLIAPAPPQQIASALYRKGRRVIGLKTRGIKPAKNTLLSRSCGRQFFVIFLIVFNYFFPRSPFPPDLQV